MALRTPEQALEQAHDDVYMKAISKGFKPLIGLRHVPEEKKTLVKFPDRNPPRQLTGDDLGWGSGFSFSSYSGVLEYLECGGDSLDVRRMSALIDNDKRNILLLDWAFILYLLMKQQEKYPLIPC